jgi:four helix bundle protein
MIVKLYQFLVNDKKEFVLSKQLLRSGTSIGANIREAEQAESKTDFIHKMSISLKEANESEYWIELLYRANYLDENQFIIITKELREILKLLTSIIKTSKNNK